MITLFTALILVTASEPSQGAGGEYETLHVIGNPVSGSFDFFGFSTSGAGDLNSDGFADLLVSAHQANVGGLATAGLVYAFSGADGSTLYQWQGQNSGDRFGTSVSNAGDVNGDGFADIIVGAPRQIGSSAAYVFSGVDGSQLFQLNEPASAQRFGHSVSGAGDLNQDGFADLVIGAYGASPGGIALAGSAFAISGADGSQLYRWDGTSNGGRFGDCVSDAGDVNGDGVPDVIVGAYKAMAGGLQEAGSAYVYSGADGSLLHQWDGRTRFTYFGISVSGAGDVNQDGFSDLIVGAAHFLGSANAGSAYVLSGFDGSLLYQWAGEAPYVHFGYSASEAGDVNGDGYDDVIVGAEATNVGGLNQTGSAFLYSGANGSLMHRWDGEAFNVLGCSVSNAGDVNQDGLSDVIVGAYGADPGGLGSFGAAFVYSLNPFLLSSTTSVALATATQIDLQIDFPDTAANYGYKVLISVSGPGQMFKGVDIPLTEDFMVHETYYGNYPFANHTDLQGTLDATGDATASVSIAANELHASLVGRTFHIVAAASFDGFTPAEYSSVAVPIEITP